jgi:hypothetical protein
VSADQLHRWRNWRKVGFIPRSAERIRGYWPDVEIPPRELRWIEVAAASLQEDRDADVAAMRVAAAGFMVDERALKSALLGYFDRVIVKREQSNAWPYRRTARGRGSIARAEAALVADYQQLGAEPPTPATIVDRPVEAHVRHRRSVLAGEEPAAIDRIHLIGIGEIPAAAALDEARSAIVAAPPGDVAWALRFTGSPEGAVDYLVRGLVALYRDALTATTQ